MLTMLKRFAIVIGSIGSLGFVSAIIKRLRARAISDETRMLKQLAATKSSSIPELSGRLKLASDDTIQLLDSLEQRGWVQMSGDQGAGHVRIAAITKAGRDQIA